MNVRRVQQLLHLAKKPVKVTQHWNAETEHYLNELRQEGIKADPALFYLADAGDVESEKSSVSPTEPVLFELAHAAGVLIRTGVGWLRGAEAFADTHHWLEQRGASFEFYSEHVVWGLKGLPGWAIVMQKAKGGGYDFHDFSENATLALNCTVYANLMMAVWSQGGVHGGTYSPDCSESGGVYHFAHARYHYPIVGYFEGAQSVRSAVKHPDRLYCLEFAPEKNRVSHMALLWRNTVYECNVTMNKTGVQSSSLDSWMRTHSSVWLLGPAPG